MGFGSHRIRTVDGVPPPASSAEGVEPGSILHLEKNSGCRVASAAARSGIGGGGAGNQINGENVFGCWATASAHSNVFQPCGFAGNAPLQSVRGNDGGYGGGHQAGTYVHGGGYAPVGPSQGWVPPYALRGYSTGRRVRLHRGGPRQVPDGRLGERHRVGPSGAPSGPQGGLHRHGPCEEPADCRGGLHWGRPCAGPAALGGELVQQE